MSVFYDEWGRPIYKVDRYIRCRGQGKDGRPCKKLLAEFAARPYRLACPRCKTVNESFPDYPEVSEGRVAPPREAQGGGK